MPTTHPLQSLRQILLLTLLLCLTALIGCNSQSSPPSSDLDQPPRRPLESLQPEPDRWKTHDPEITELRSDAAPSKNPDQSDFYIVQAGDTLYAIAARQLGNGQRWHQIYDLNRNIIKDPRQLSAGMVLKMPPP